MSIVSRKLLSTNNLSIFNNIRYLSVQSSALCASNKYKNDLTKTTHTGQVKIFNHITISLLRKQLFLYKQFPYVLLLF